ncbi:MAG: carboxymethylenebutenolidase [Acetobacteraceae bacterium]|jgi:hypothetical protein|nr:carboxymethylenebutenolidase [Acetobacteraceae bacterium]
MSAKVYFLGRTHFHRESACGQFLHVSSTYPLAVANFIAFAPDGLTSLGGYPGGDEKGLALFGQLDRAKMGEDFLAADYRERVAAVGAEVLTGIGGLEPLFATAVRQGNVRLAVVGGGVLVINIHRQPRARFGKTMSRCRIALELAPLLSSRVRGC